MKTNEGTVSKLTWEQPLGTIRGQLEEPGPRFIDPYDKEEREAIKANSQNGFFHKDASHDGQR